jgi:hypothetical protein
VSSMVAPPMTAVEKVVLDHIKVLNSPRAITFQAHAWTKGDWAHIRVYVHAVVSLSPY